MKINVLLLLTTYSILTSCQGGGSGNKSTADTIKQFPKPGTVMAAAEMPIAEDSLNHFKFSVKVVADSNVHMGTYDVDADFGPNFAEGQMTMPKGGEGLRPDIRKGSSPYTYIIGFRLPGDTAFYDYFEVRGSRSTTTMQYIKAYAF